MCCNLLPSFCSVIDLLFVFFQLNGFEMCRNLCVCHKVRYYYKCLENSIYMWFKMFLSLLSLSLDTP